MAALKGKPQSASEMAEHIRMMMRDLKENPGNWENVSLESFLESLAAVFEDHQGCLLKVHETGAVPYGVLADLLSAASIYE